VSFCGCEDQTHYYLNVLLPFTQANALKVCVDAGGGNGTSLALDLYEELGREHAPIRDWLRLLDLVKPGRAFDYVETPQVDGNAATLFLTISENSAPERCLLAVSRQHYAKAACERRGIRLLDKDESVDAISVAVAAQGKGATFVSKITVKGKHHIVVGGNVSVTLSSVGAAHGTDVADAVERLVALVGESGNAKAEKELSKLMAKLSAAPLDKRGLQAAWNGLVKILPALETMAGIAAKIVPLFA
jgi:hypothetical protein